MRKAKVQTNQLYGFVPADILENKGISTPNLDMRTVRKREHMLFNFLTFSYFRRADGFRFLMEGGPFAIFFVIPYLVFSEVYFFRQRRYFVLLEHQVVGVLALREEPEDLYVSSMAVSPDYRRIGVATYTLNQAAAIATRLCKQTLELTVIKKNAPAIKLYERHGYRIHAERRRSLILRKRISRF